MQVCAISSTLFEFPLSRLCLGAWNVSEVHEAWFANEENVRRTVGLPEKPVVQFPNARELTCGICFETYPCSRIKSAACGHPFCISCWEGYIGTAINDGPGCLMLRCSEPSCAAAVDNKKTKWCSAPGCEYAVTFDAGSGNYDVSCLCSYCFCWNCTEEAHRPVDCGTVAKWILKNSAVLDMGSGVWDACIGDSCQLQALSQVQATN
ncbi:hypothetical protein K1719_032829 [Acacia pycnantha]|nr:hypothetical protein K1719_032829 [Acacia pycnantha]